MTHTSPSRSPLWKQLLGAVGGAAIALLLYSGSRMMMGTVASLLPAETAAQTETAVEEAAPTSAQDERMDRIAMQVRDVVAQASTQVDATVTSDPAAPENGMIFETMETTAEADARADVFEEEARAEESVVAPAVTAQSALHEGAPNLPSSGLGIWLAITMSLAGALVTGNIARRKFKGAYVH